MSMLSMEDISISFYGAYANEHVQLSVERGEIHALLGENGAGKTTLMNILFGIYKAESGRILWEGEEVHFQSPLEAIKAGIGMVHQHFSLVNAMTVLDNVLLGYEMPFFMPRKKMRQRLIELSDLYGLKVDPDAIVGELSIGEKQRVEILKALFRDIKLLILDEPTGVLTPKETKQLFSVLRQLKEKGFAVIIITHRMSEIMAITDRVTVLRDGKSVATLVTSESSPEELSHAMVGRTLNVIENKQEKAPGQPLLTLDGVTVYRSGRKRPALENVTLTIREGEILGVAGVEGNGQKELAEAIVGIRRGRVKGKILLGEDDLTGTTVRARADKGMAYVPDDRQHDALVPDMDVSENLLLRTYKKAPFSKARVFNRKQINARAQSAVESYAVRTAGTLGVKSPARLLSGGNQQKVVLAREISPESRFIVASQPTRGLDVSASAFVREKLLEQKKQGKGVMLISADLEEILMISDRIIVMDNGRISGELDRKDATIDTLGMLMGGVKQNQQEANA